MSLSSATNLHKLAVFLFFTIYCIQISDSIRCYQCTSSDDKGKNVDTCGVYSRFDTERNIPVDCQGDESVTTGTFCVKITQQSPRGFIWDGRWRQVIRRCASVTEYGVTGVCNWGIYENGVYWEECYCSNDACNHGFMAVTISPSLIVASVLAIFCTNLLSL